MICFCEFRLVVIIDFVGWLEEIVFWGDNLDFFNLVFFLYELIFVILYLSFCFVFKVCCFFCSFFLVFFFFKFLIRLLMFFLIIFFLWIFCKWELYFDLLKLENGYILYLYFFYLRWRIMCFFKLDIDFNWILYFLYCLFFLLSKDLMLFMFKYIGFVDCLDFMIYIRRGCLYFLLRCFCVVEVFFIVIVLDFIFLVGCFGFFFIYIFWIFIILVFGFFYILFWMLGWIVKYIILLLFSFFDFLFLVFVVFFLVWMVVLEFVDDFFGCFVVRCFLFFFIVKF